MPRLPRLVALVVSAMAAGAFLIPTGEATTAGGPPQFRLAHLVLTQPLQVFGVLAIIYFIVCFTLSRGISLLDARVRRTRAMR